MVIASYHQVSVMQTIKLTELLELSPCESNKEFLRKIYDIQKETDFADLKVNPETEDSHSLTGSSEIMKSIIKNVGKVKSIKVKPITIGDPIPVEVIHGRKYKPKKADRKKFHPYQ